MDDHYNIQAAGEFTIHIPNIPNFNDHPAQTLQNLVETRTKADTRNQLLSFTPVSQVQSDLMQLILISRASTGPRHNNGGTDQSTYLLEAGYHRF
jgi:hypothetical protein